MKLFVTIYEATPEAALATIRSVTLDHDGIELRAEAFNLLNTFNWGPPGLINSDRTHIAFISGAFGRITTISGTPRVMQFGIKYGF